MNTEIRTDGQYVTLVQTGNVLKIVPNTETVSEFVCEWSHYISAELLERLGIPSKVIRTSRPRTWSDSTLLRDLLEHQLSNGWEELDPSDVGALTDAPILKAPDGRIYWHERYAIELAGEMLALGQTVTFDGAPENT